MIEIVLGAYVLLCIFTDMRYRKVYNRYSVSAVILGCGLNYLYYGAEGVRIAAFGFMAGFIFLFPFYLAGGLGAGDVKFMAAVGCLKGPGFAIISGLYGALAGGVAALVILGIKGRLRQTLRNVYYVLANLVLTQDKKALHFNTENPVYLPYTVFLSIGVAVRWLELYWR